MDLPTSEREWIPNESSENTDLLTNDIELSLMGASNAVEGTQIFESVPDDATNFEDTSGIIIETTGKHFLKF